MIPGRIQISRPSYGDCREKISITIKDQDAGVELVEVEIDLDQFARALTGQAGIPCEIEPKNLNIVGKIVERKDLEFLLYQGEGFYDNKKLACELLPKHTPEGWVASDYFGSQNSFYYKELDNGNTECWAKTNMRRWIDRE